MVQIRVSARPFHEEVIFGGQPHAIVHFVKSLLEGQEEEGRMNIEQIFMFLGERGRNELNWFKKVQQRAVLVSVMFLLNHTNKRQHA
jgi:hypothetical protein